MVTALLFAVVTLLAEELPPVLADVAEENRYYRLVDVPMPKEAHFEASSFLELDDGRLVIGTRRGEVYFVTGATEDPPAPKYELFASGLHEVFGIAYRDDTLYVTQQCEVTRLIDRNGDGRADRYETVSDYWGFGAYHEYTFGSDFDKNGDMWLVHCLTASYRSENAFRGWSFRVRADGTATPTCSGIRSPCGVGFDKNGDPFYAESQGPWNGCCSLKPLKPGGFMGHPISYNWYDLAPNMGPAPAQPTGGRDGRLHLDLERIPELVPPAVKFPYKKMGQSASAIRLDRSEGRFGPFAEQLFVTDYTLSLVMRVALEKVDGVDQGACFPFREGLATGLIGAELTRDGHLLTGGSKRGWPVRGPSLFALQRLDWTGETPFEVRTMSVRPDGFELAFTLPVDPAIASDPASYSMTTYTHHYRAAYGSPEIDHTTPVITKAVPSADGSSVRLRIEGMQVGHVHELHLPGVRSRSGEPLLHPVAYYQVNVIPR